MTLVPPIKNSVHASICLIERTFTQYGDEAAQMPGDWVEGWAIKYEPAKSIFRGQARMVWLTAIERQMPVEPRFCYH